MCVFALLDPAAAIGGCVEDFGGQPLFHRLFAARARRRNQPSHRQRIAPHRAHLARHLVVGAADPARAHLDGGTNIVERAFEDDQAVFLRAFGDEIERVIKDLLGERLLAAFHHDVHELRDGAVVILGVRRNFADANLSFARHITLLGFLRPVLGTALAPLLHADRVEGAANHVIANARQIAHATAANQHHRMLLQVVSDARDIGIHLDPVGQPHACDLAQRGVGLLGRRRLHLRAYAALLRRAFERARLNLEALFHARLSDQLIYRRHVKILVLGFSLPFRPAYPSDVRRLSSPLGARIAPARCAGLPLGGRGVQTNPPRTLTPLGETSLCTGPDPPCQSPPGAGAAVSSAFPASSSSAAAPSTLTTIRLYKFMPVPAGIKRPMITFSFSPTSLSTLPLMADSVSTRVVSWNDAAEMKLSVEREALVMPSSSGSAMAGSPPRVSTRPFSSSKRHFST